MIDYKLSDYLLKRLKKLAKKDKVLYEAVMKKIEQIVNVDPDHYKNLKYDLKEEKRVHIGHFVLTFMLKEGKIFFEDFDHHDNIY